MFHCRHDIKRHAAIPRRKNGARQWPHDLAHLGLLPGPEVVVEAGQAAEVGGAPNIRVTPFDDFEVLARRSGVAVSGSFGLQVGRVVRRWPDLRASVAVCCFGAG